MLPTGMYGQRMYWLVQSGMALGRSLVYLTGKQPGFILTTGNVSRPRIINMRMGRLIALQVAE